MTSYRVAGNTTAESLSWNGGPAIASNVFHREYWPMTAT
ncbi:hypothetical protein FB004_103190 [Sinorhizobium medicae]|nr:hypothetical protein FB004_103190 [Sinorhizobium medicae]